MESAFHQQTRICSSIRFFRQSKNLSEETRSRAALHFDRIMLPNISKQLKKANSHTGLDKFQKSGYRFCITLYGSAGNKRLNPNELNSDVKLTMRFFLFFFSSNMSYLIALTFE